MRRLPRDGGCPPQTLLPLVRSSAFSAFDDVLHCIELITIAASFRLNIRGGIASDLMLQTTLSHTGASEIHVVAIRYALPRPASASR